MGTISSIIVNIILHSQFIGQSWVVHEFNDIDNIFKDDRLSFLSIDYRMKNIGTAEISQIP